MDEYRCLVPFPDESPSFVHGFEAGVLWQQMQTAQYLIGGAGGLPLHVENREVYQRMAAAMGYDMAMEPSNEGTWAYYSFTKRRSHLTVIAPPDQPKPEE